MESMWAVCEQLGAEQKSHFPLGPDKVTEKWNSFQSSSYEDCSIWEAIF